MKLLVVLGINAYKEDLKKILFEHQVAVFSEMEADGFRIPSTNDSESNGWFSGSKKPVFSAVSIAFTEEKQAQNVLAALEEFNKQTDIVNPFHGYQLSIEKSI